MSTYRIKLTRKSEVLDEEYYQVDDQFMEEHGLKTMEDLQEFIRANRNDKVDPFDTKEVYHVCTDVYLDDVQVIPGEVVKLPFGMRSPLYYRKAPCNECPFLKTSAPGWLGPHSVDDITKLFIDRTIPFSCHKYRERYISPTKSGHSPLLPICRGSLDCIRNSAKLPHPNTHIHKVFEVIKEEPRNDQVLSRHQFIKHHTKNQEE